MGSLSSRSSNTVEETDIGTNHAYKYPPKSGNYFGTHFIMGGERFDTPQPEAYLFGENADLNFLGSRPTAFPYPPPQTNEPTKTLKSLINIRKESVRFVKINDVSKLKDNDNETAVIGKDDTNTTVAPMTKGNSFNLEFIFDSDAKCAITIYYFCTEEITSSGLSFVPRDSSLTSETYHYKRGVNQLFSQPTHQINPNMFSDDDLSYNPERDVFPVAIHCVVEEGIEESITKQSHTTVCVIDHHAADGAYVLRALKQKIFVDGLCYLLQEIYGIENKNINKISMDEDTDDNGSECVICMCDTRDTLILPCRHLCLCNSCADSLRYQASNCPICRAPFRALLQIRSVQKSLTAGSTPTTTTGATTTTLTPTAALAANLPTTILPTQNVMISQTQNSQDNNDNLPPGYISVPLIEALNGPPQIILRNQHSIDTIDINEIDAAQAADQLNRSLDKQNSPKHVMDKHSKEKINPPEQIRMSVLIPKDDGLTHTKHGSSMVENVTTNNSNSNANNNNNHRHDKSPRPKIIRSLQLQQEQYGTGALSASSLISHRDNVKIINEKNLQYNLHSPITQTTPTSMTSSSSKPSMMDVDDDSDAEKLSPLLDQPLKKLSIKERKNHQQQLQHQHQPLTNLIINNSALHMDGVDESIDDTDTDIDEQECDKNMRSDISNIAGGGGGGVNSDAVGGVSGIDAGITGDILLAGAEDSDYYTPEDPHTTILSPLCSDKKSANDLTKSKDNLTINHPSPLSNIKQAKTNSLPDSPISGNSTSTRSSGDSYSSSSSTRQLLSASIPSQDIIKLSDDKQQQQPQHSIIDKIVAV